MSKRLHRVRDDRGASAVEYGLLIAAIAVVIVVTVFAFGQATSGLFSKTSTCVATNGSSGGC